MFLAHLVPPGDGLGGLAHLALLLEQGVLQVLRLLLGHLPQVGLGPDQFGLLPPREDVSDSSWLAGNLTKLRELDLNILQVLTTAQKSCKIFLAPSEAQGVTILVRPFVQFKLVKMSQSSSFWLSFLSGLSCTLMSLTDLS